ncbi:MAG: hypothetical protein QOI58_4170 [Thermoanaerobaculia bacterium]|jgi:hypothetical protein|nr:hypothetical protein [Thermoanaerobaculia bacterium]
MVAERRGERANLAEEFKSERLLQPALITDYFGAICCTRVQ